VCTLSRDISQTLSRLAAHLIMAQAVTSHVAAAGTASNAYQAALKPRENV
jgi:hypothetical protein